MRTHIAIAGILALTLTSCAGQATGPSVGASQEVGGSARPTAARPSSPSFAPSSQPASPSASAPASEPSQPAIQVGDYLKVTGDGLAVRSGPGREHALVSEYLLGREEPIETTLLRGEVRLPAGYVVRAQLGPLVVDDTAWVAVRNVPQAGQAEADTPLWRTVAPVCS